VPSGANAYVLKSVIHNWSDERAGIILQRCAQAMASGGKLILVERIVPQRLESSTAHRTIALMDLNMLAHPGRPPGSAGEAAKVRHIEK